MRQALLAAAALLAVSFAARADTFQFTATGTGLSATGTFEGTPDPFTPGAFDLTSGSGLVNGMAFTLYTPSGDSIVPVKVRFTSPPFTYVTDYTYDNVFYTNGPGIGLDVSGLLVSTATDHFNFFGAGQNYVYSNDEIINGFNSPLDSLTITPLAATTPEPSSIALLGTGLLGAAGLLRKRRRA